MPPQPEPMSRTFWPGCSSSLAAMWLLLVELGLLQRLVAGPEVGAGILPVAVEEEIVELVR